MAFGGFDQLVLVGPGWRGVGGLFVADGAGEKAYYLQMESWGGTCRFLYIISLRLAEVGRPVRGTCVERLGGVDRDSELVMQRQV